jgi:hypothetical protein
MNLPPSPAIDEQAASAELAMLDVYLPMMKSAAILSAGRLGLFEALAHGPLTLDALASHLQSSPRGTATLTDFLVAIGYLHQHDGHYANTPGTQRWFTSQGQVDYTPGLLWTQEAWSMMGALTDAVRAGGPEKTLWESMLDHPPLGQLFSSYMAAFAHDLGPDLLRHVPVSAEHRCLLDLGGSHGLHAIRFCRQHPHLSAVIVDLPSALSATPDSIAASGLEERIQLRPGNLFDTDWACQPDLVFYLCVAHNQSAEQNRAVIQRIAQSMHPDGLLVIHEYLAEAELSPFHAAFRLTLLLETGTQIYRHEDYVAWLTEAGFSSIARIDLKPREKGTLLLARRGAATLG